MSDLYTYVMKHDSGLAPNPFWGTCSLAVCTPNHQGSRAKRGDWIAGVSDKGRGYKIIYVMEVDERVHMNDYFIDERCRRGRRRRRSSQRCAISRGRSSTGSIVTRLCYTRMSRTPMFTLC